jgi:hypothetical protein
MTTTASPVAPPVTAASCSTKGHPLMSIVVRGLRRRRRGRCITVLRRRVSCSRIMGICGRIRWLLTMLTMLETTAYTDLGGPTIIEAATTPSCTVRGRHGMSLTTPLRCRVLRLVRLRIGLLHAIGRLLGVMGGCGIRLCGISGMESARRDGSWRVGRALRPVRLTL